jgi:hypothetical protein
MPTWASQAKERRDESGVGGVGPAVLTMDLRTSPTVLFTNINVPGITMKRTAWGEQHWKIAHRNRCKPVDLEEEYVSLGHLATMQRERLTTPGEVVLM